MANNYQDIVGQIYLEKMTPVIAALFKTYNLNPHSTYPGNGVYGIWCGELVSNGHDYPTWENFAESLRELCQQLNIVVDDENIEEENEFYAYLLKLLFTFFGAIDKEDAKAYIEVAKTCDPYDFVELRYLFNIAQLMSDGHGLKRYEVDSAFYCSKPRHQEFGGYGEYHSHHVHSFESSIQACLFGAALEEDLLAKRYDAAAARIVDETVRSLNCITNVEDRQQVQSLVVKEMNTLHTPIPQGQPASNEAQMSLYEMPVFILSPQEQREAIAESAYKISVNWAERTDIDPYEKCFGVAGDMLRMFQNGYGATVPPMQITPVNWGGPFTYDVQRENLSGKNEFEPAQWVYDKPIALSSVTDSVSEQFDEIVESYHRRSVNAAKKMFGT
jgi:hypothetical protein